MISRFELTQRLSNGMGNWESNSLKEKFYPEPKHLLLHHFDSQFDSHFCRIYSNQTVSFQDSNPTTADTEERLVIHLFCCVSFSCHSNNIDRPTNRAEQTQQLQSCMNIFLLKSNHFRKNIINFGENIRRKIEQSKSFR